MLYKFWNWLLEFFILDVKEDQNCNHLIFSSSIKDKMSFNLKKGYTKMLMLLDNQYVEIKVQPMTEAGNPTNIMDKPKWYVSDDTIIKLEPSADGLSCKATTTGKLGNCQVKAIVDADPTDQNREVSGTLDIQVFTGHAAFLSLIAQAPKEKQST